MYFKGSLKKTMQEFDSCLKGKPFQFKLGKGDVIKGLEDGVEGLFRVNRCLNSTNT